MNHPIRFPDSIELDPATTNTFMVFLQRMANRRVVGGLRYGYRPKAEQKYLSRLKVEVAAYTKTGNSEHLFNIANYCFLESQAPENKRFHWDNTTESVTRKKFGGSIA
jgi:hypothetical protein